MPYVIMMGLLVALATLTGYIPDVKYWPLPLIGSGIFTAVMLSILAQSSPRN